MSHLHNHVQQLKEKMDPTKDFSEHLVISNSSDVMGGHCLIIECDTSVM